jgi:hypothetical protein
MVIQLFIVLQMLQFRCVFISLVSYGFISPNVNIDLLEILYPMLTLQSKIIVIECGKHQWTRLRVYLRSLLHVTSIFRIYL